MPATYIASQVRRAAHRFAAANQGNIAVIFAIALVPIISFIGAAIDYTRANAARSSMQAALDSTALMLSKDQSEGLIDQSDRGLSLFRRSTPIPTPIPFRSMRLHGQQAWPTIRSPAPAGAT
jgi:hypothetical protein